MRRLRQRNLEFGVMRYALRWLVLGGVCLCMVGGTRTLAATQPAFYSPQPSLPHLSSASGLLLVRKTPSCRADFEPLVQHLLEDLPSYANRANIRYGKSNSYVMLTGLPEFAPLPLDLKTDLSTQGNNTSPTDPKQVFFTTLVRRYEGNRPRQFQEYHWLFLTNTDSGWRFSMMYSMLGSYPQNSPPFPPRNSSEGSLAQAIRTWLRDCRQSTLPGLMRL